MKEIIINEAQREPKPHNTGIRFGDSFKNYVTKFPGKGFNKQLESMVIYLMKNEDDILNRIEKHKQDFLRQCTEYDAIIQKKQDKIRELGDRELILSKASNDLIRVTELFDNIKDNIEKLSTPTE